MTDLDDTGHLSPPRASHSDRRSGRLGPPRLSIERRRHPRVRARLRVQYASLDAFLDAYTADISLGGCHVESDSPRAVGEDVDLAIHFPQVPEPILVSGTVVRTASHARNRTSVATSMAVRFTFDDDEEQRQFHVVLGSLLAERD